MNLYDIIEAIAAGRFRFTNHAEVEAANDGLTESEIYYSVFHGEILEITPMTNHCLAASFMDYPLKVCRFTAFGLATKATAERL